MLRPALAPPSLHHLLPRIVLELQHRREIWEAMLRSGRVPAGPAIGLLDLSHSMALQRFLNPSLQAVMHAGLPASRIPALAMAILREGLKSPGEMRAAAMKMLSPRI